MQSANRPCKAFLDPSVAALDQCVCITSHPGMHTYAMRRGLLAEPGSSGGDCELEAGGPGGIAIDLSSLFKISALIFS
jgi:hypothetical protein